MERIHVRGSLRQAALQMKMSYKQAWDLVKHTNKHLHESIVVLHRAGTGGAKAVITEKGLDSIKQYNELQVRFNEFLKQQTELIKIK